MPDKSKFTTRNNSILQAVIAGVGVVGIFLLTVAYLSHRDTVDRENNKKILAAELARDRDREMAQQHAAVEADEWQRQQKILQEQKDAAADTKENKNRCDLTDGLDLYMAYHTGRDQTIRAVDSSVAKVPLSEQDLKSMPAGDCRQAIFYFGRGASEMANAFVEQPDGAQKGLIDSGFRRAIFIDGRSVCEALIMPRPLGLGEMVCHDK